MMHRHQLNRHRIVTISGKTKGAQANILLPIISAFIFASAIFYAWVHCLHLAPSPNDQLSLPPDTLDPPNEGSECLCVDCAEDKWCGGLWNGNAFPPANDVAPQDQKIHIIVAHCHRALGWISEFAQGYNVSSIHVISKCGQQVRGAPVGATIERLPNVGRCDHSYAYYIARRLERAVFQDEEQGSIVMFLKDDHPRNIHGQGQSNTFESIVRGASSTNGFACGLDMSNTDFSCYHDTEALSQFKMGQYFGRTRGDGTVQFKSSFRSLGEFYRNMTLVGNSPELVQGCYGGRFAASYANIKRVGAPTWERIISALSRGDSIEEGHFMERSWGRLLAKPLQPFQIVALWNHSKSVLPFPLTGALSSTEPAA